MRTTSTGIGLPPGSATYTLEGSHGLWWQVWDPEWGYYSGQAMPVQQMDWAEYADPLAPQISQIAPNHGVVSQNGYVVIYGQNLSQEGTVVTMDGQTLTVTYPGNDQRNSSYTAQQASSVGSKLVVVTNPHGSAQEYFYIEASDRTPVIDSITPSEWPAGQTTSFVVQGQNFGTSPQIQITCGGSACQGVTGSGVSSGWDHQISAWVQVEGSAPDQQVEVKVTSQGMWGNGFLAGQGNTPAGSQGYMAQIRAGNVNRLEIWLCDNDGSNCTVGVNNAANITGAVGQINPGTLRRIEAWWHNLATDTYVEASGGQWNFPQLAYRGMDFSLPQGGEIALDQSQWGLLLTARANGFQQISYAINGSTASAYISANGLPYTIAATAQFLNQSTNGSNVYVDDSYPKPGYQGYFALYPSRIDFHAEGGTSGTYGWVQIVDALNVAKVGGTNVAQFSCKGNDAKGAVGNTAVYSTNANTNDQPVTVVDSLYPGVPFPADEFIVTEGFKMYLMYKPPGADEFVPIGLFDWAWSGSAAKSTNSWYKSAPGQATVSTFTPSSSPPTWSSDTVNCAWQ